MNDSTASAGRYAIVTAAYNEAKYIERLIRSVVAQTHRATRWVIVSDGSTDGTDEIVSKYAQQYPFICLHRITDDHPRTFVAQVHAINAGFAVLEPLRTEFIGNLDADIELEPGYFKALLDCFDNDQRLGLAGGYIYEVRNGVFCQRPSNSPWSVAHAIQLFRRQCLQDIGGCYTPLPYGGPDWYAEIRARMRGWKVQAIPALPVRHYRPTGAEEGRMRSATRMGLMDYTLGTHPLFEVCKMARRIKSARSLLSASVRYWSFLSGHWRRKERCVTPEELRFVRREQLARLREAVEVRMPFR